MIQHQKIRYDLTPQYGLEEVCKVLTSKLEKYHENQWKYGMKWTEVLSNLKSHLSQFELGNDYTEEGLLHMAEVAMNALILCDFYKSYPQGDNRVFCPINKPVVVLDIDDVCLDFASSFSKKFNVELNPYWNGHYEMSNMLDQIKDDKIPESKDIRKIGKVLKSKGENSTDAKEGLLDGSLTIDEALELVSTETKIEAIQAKVDNFVSYLTDNKEEIREYVQEPSINFAIRKIIAALSSMV